MLLGLLEMLLFLLLLMDIRKNIPCEDTIFDLEDIKLTQLT